MKVVEPRFPLRLVAPRRRVLLALEGGMYWSGAAALYVRLFGARGAAIVAYHSVTDRSIARWIDPRNAIPLEIFEAQMDFLARRRKVVSMSALVDALESGENAEAGTVVISFDDGYRDTLELAAPILERHGLPAILYLSTGTAARGANQWVDELYSAFQFRTRHQLRLDGPDSPVYDLEKKDTLFEAYHATAGRLVAMEPSERNEFLEEVKAQLSAAERPPRLMLTWPEVKELTRRYPGFEIGGHTREHLDLTACGEEAARADLKGSMADIAGELKIEVVHLAYPYGRTNERIREMVAGSSLRSAVIGESMSLVHCGTDRFAMPRIEARSAMTRFRFQTSGAYPDLPLALLGRA